jgi:hypothetical protein
MKNNELNFFSRSQTKTSETITENLFRDFYGSTTFIEKTAIPEHFGFVSKTNPDYTGYPDFLREEEDFVIIVEAKLIKQNIAINEVKHYMLKNKITKDIIGIAFSGQTIETIKTSFFLKTYNDNNIKELTNQNKFLSLSDIHKIYKKHKYGDSISSLKLIEILKEINNKFNTGNKVRDTDRSLLFSGLMIALKDDTFRRTYKEIQKSSKEEIASMKNAVLESKNLNTSIIEAITRQLATKINNLSKEFSWKDKFSFIKNIDYSLVEYKEIIKIIEEKIFKPFQNQEKQDILGKAYKIFLSRAGKVDNKNIILTPDHIKTLMVELARLNIDDVVLDTCTGSGGFLMEAMEVMLGKEESQDETTRDNITNNQLIGFEIDSVLFALACSNMFLHGDGRSNLIYRSSLLNDNDENIVNNGEEELLKYIKSLGPTKCIINPPYESNLAIKFTKQALDYLKTNWKLIIIMPTPTLIKNQNGLTEDILEIAKLDFVIKMPFNLFSEQKRTVNTSIFGFTKTKHHKNDEVLFFNLKDDGFVSIQHKGRVDKFNKWEDIHNNVKHAILGSNEIDGICIKRKIHNVNGILNCAGVINRNNTSGNMIRLSELFDIEDGSLPSESNEDGEYDFITASEEWKRHSTYSHDKEAIILAISASGSLGRTHYVNGKFIASNLCLILTEKNKTEYPVNLKFYNKYFSSIKEQLVSDLADGTSKLTISKNALENYYIDYIPLLQQSTFVEQFLIKIDELRCMIKKEEDNAQINILKIL